MQALIDLAYALMHRQRELTTLNTALYEALSDIVRIYEIEFEINDRNFNHSIDDIPQYTKARALLKARGE